MGSWMGIKNKKKKKLNYKNIFKGSSLVLLLLSLSLATLSYISSGIAQERVYSFSRYVIPKGSALQGLSMRFKKEDVSCYGILTFECEIKNAIIWAPAIKKDMLTIEQIKFGRISKRGFRIGNKIDLTIDAKNVNISDDFPLFKDSSTEGKKVKEDVFPSDITIGFNLVNYNRSEASIDTSIEINNKSFSAAIKANFMNILEENLKKIKDDNKTKNPVPNKKILTIVKDFDINVLNKNLIDLYYDNYNYYFNHAKTELDKKSVNITLIGRDDNAKRNKIDLKKEIIENINNFEKLAFKNKDNKLSTFLNSKKTYISIKYLVQYVVSKA